MIHRRLFPDGPHQLDSHVWAYFQPDGFYGLNNAGVVVDSGQSLLIDTMFDNRRTRTMLKRLAEAEAQAGKIDILVNTHSHCDHAGGNSVLPHARRIMTPRMAEEFSRVRPEYFFGAMSTATGDARLMITGLLADKFDLSDASYAAPTETFEGRLELHIGSTDVHLIEIGALHTSSDVVVYIPSAGVVFAGDVMMADSHFPIHGSDLDAGIEFFRQMLQWDADKFVPGHGGLCTREDVQEHLDYMQFFRDESSRYFAAGLDSSEAAMKMAGNLGRFSRLHRTDLILQNLRIRFGHLSNQPHHTDLQEYLGERWRFARALESAGIAV